MSGIHTGVAVNTSIPPTERERERERQDPRCTQDEPGSHSLGWGQENRGGGGEEAGKSTAERVTL